MYERSAAVPVGDRLGDDDDVSGLPAGDDRGAAQTGLHVDQRRRFPHRRYRLTGQVAVARVSAVPRERTAGITSEAKSSMLRVVCSWVMVPIENRPMIWPKPSSSCSARSRVV